MEEKNIKFLTKINLRTDRILKLFSGLGERQGLSFNFEDYSIPTKIFEKIIKIIKEESLLVKIELSGLYRVCNLKGQTILQFSKNNITKEMEDVLLGLAQK
jgi:hypothetical protein